MTIESPKSPTQVAANLLDRICMECQRSVESLKWVKIVTVGNCLAGKTSLIKTYLKNDVNTYPSDERLKYFTEYYSTVGLDYGFRVQNLNVQQKKESIKAKNDREIVETTAQEEYNFEEAVQNSQTRLRVHLWDLSGDPEFYEIRNEVYNEMDVLMLVFDMTNRASFESVGYWFQEAMQCTNRAKHEITTVLIGTRADQTEKNASQKSMSKLELCKLCSKLNCTFYEISIFRPSVIHKMFADVLTGHLKPSSPFTQLQKS